MLRLFPIILWLSIVSRQVDAASLADAIDPMIQSHRGEVSVAIKNLKTGETYENHGDRVMPTASLIKVAVMIEAYRQAEAGMLDLSERIELVSDSKVPGSGILTKHISSGTRITLGDAIRLMIVFSDNTATNLVIQKVGLRDVNSTMEDLGCSNTKLHSLVFRRETSIFPDRSRLYGLGSTTANEMVSIFERIQRGEIVSAKACESMLDHLSACDDRTMLARTFSKETKIAHKSGAVSKSRTDAGLFRTNHGTIAICVLTTNNQDRSWNDDNASHVLCGAIARAAMSHFHDPGTRSESTVQSLVVGASGELVEHLQRTLNTRLTPSPNLAVDGDFGPATEAAVRDFQTKMRLESNGEVNAATWKALGTLVTRDRPVPDPSVVNRQVMPREESDSLAGVPFVTCKAWIAIDAEMGRVLGGSNEHQPLHAASTTKMMTAYVVLMLAEQDPSLLSETVVFSARADGTIGSTAALQAGERLAVGELLYGLLLPSGNDASVAIAEHFGARCPGIDDPAVDDYQRFIREMNRTAKRLGMHQTRYKNPHGLTDEEHLTTASDLAMLGRMCMKVPRFERSSTTPQHGCTVVNARGASRNLLWKNTNRLLAIDGYHGIKTGTTKAAGACLVSYGTRDGNEAIVVVLGSATSAARYVDTRNLFRWTWHEFAKKVSN